MLKKITFNESIGNRQSTIGLNKLNNCQLTIGEVDSLISEFNHLIEQPYRKWFIKQLYRVGAVAFRKAAANAIAGRSPKKLFAKLLKEA